MMNEIEKLIIIPLIIKFIAVLVSGVYNWYRFSNSGQVVASYKHKVLDREEIVAYIIIFTIAVALALYFNAQFLYAIGLAFVGIILSKIKMSKDITLSENGILVKGQYEQWDDITNVEIDKNNIVEVDFKKKEYEITGLEDSNEFIKMCQYCTSGH